MKTTRFCSIDGCERKHYGHGLCNMHWLRQRRTGSTADPVAPVGCTVEGCDGEHYARGWCEAHYSRWRRHGDVCLRAVKPDWPLAERLFFWTDIGDEDSCWPWRGSTSDQGYPLLRWDGGTKLVHRLVYELYVGPIPEGLEIDHTCHTKDSSCAGGVTCSHRRCLNHRHLEPVTPKENMRRMAERRRPHEAVA